MFSYMPSKQQTERKMRDYDKKTFTQVFNLCDEGNKGHLSREDMKTAMVMLFGYKPSKMETNLLMKAALESNLPGVPLDSFVALMGKNVSVQDPYDKARQIFSAFDVQCRGFLKLDDFERAFTRVAPQLPKRTVLEAFREVDQDSDGHVSFRDFERVLRLGEDDPDL